MLQAMSARMRWSARQSALGLALTLCAAGPAPACPLALILALDTSASVSAREDQLQKQGLAAALTDAAVVEAVRLQGGIWLAAFEWSGTRHQTDRLDWTFVDTAAGLEAVAARMRQTGRQAERFPTALGFALLHAVLRLRQAPVRCSRQVIDIAGDGVNNDGFPPESAYRAADFAGITINALVITGDLPPPAPYYRDEVIRGPGAFVEIAEGYEDYARAMRRKLLREISPSYVSRH
jgi:Ca-activated chloride channel homolog